ncbi:MAG TPA: TIGR04086 family membrane protein [Clostridia bacterium]|nr:TIGR04086 family membrane protein [Clostridia bacterium]
MAKNRNRRTASDESGIKVMSLRILKGALIGFLMFFITISLLSLIFLKADFPQSFLPAAAFLVTAMSSLMSGFAAARPTRKNGLTTGAFSAIPLAVGILTVLLINNKGDLGINTVFMLIIMLVFCSIGGVVAANKRARVR